LSLLSWSLLPSGLPKFMQNDSVTIAPHIHKVVFEDDNTRVLEVSVKPNDKAEMHAHPKNIVYVIKPGTLEFTNQQGESKQVNLTEGQVISSNETTHAVKNIGDSEVFAVQIEFK
jgi:quercetin dioxygenase-like cupin family protein